MRQGKASRDVKDGGKVEPRPYAINQHFPSQLGAAIDPLCAEKTRLGPGYRGGSLGPTDGMGQGPGANRDGGPGRPIRKSGGQGTY